MRPLASVITAFNRFRHRRPTGIQTHVRRTCQDRGLIQKSRRAAPGLSGFPDLTIIVAGSLSKVMAQQLRPRHASTTNVPLNSVPVGQPLQNSVKFPLQNDHRCGSHIERFIATTDFHRH